VTAPIQRKLPGTPVPREKFEWEELRCRNHSKGPVASRQQLTLVRDSRSCCCLYP
jgi:hypothetical protein